MPTWKRYLYYTAPLLSVLTLAAYWLYFTLRILFVMSAQRKSRQSFPMAWVFIGTLNMGRRRISILVERMFDGDKAMARLSKMTHIFAVNRASVRKTFAQVGIHEAHYIRVRRLHLV